MTCAAGSDNLGVTCAYTQSGLAVGTDYTYYFVAHDDQGSSASATALIDAPDIVIVYRIYLPLIMKNAGPPVGAPVLNAIDNPDGDYQYSVSWSAVESATATRSRKMTTQPSPAQ